MWAVLYDDGTSLTTVSEPIAHSLAAAERQRGRHVIVRRLDDAADGAQEPEPEPEPIHPAGRLARPEPISQPVPILEPEPARTARPTRRRRLLLYALTAVSILGAAALADHWGVLPRVGATTSSNSTQVSGPPHRPQLLPPLNQPPVMHFTSAVRARPTPPRPQSATGESSGGKPSAAARGG
jgi:hypothetical protein